MKEANDMQLQPNEQKTLEKIVVYLENSIAEIESLLPKDSGGLYKGMENIFSDMTKEKERISYALKYYNVSINELNLPKRAYNCLTKNGIKNIGKLFQYSSNDLLNLKNGFGKKSLQDVKRALSKYNLDFKEYFL